MCTLVLAHRCLPGVRLAVAANRDEMLARAASGPRLHPGPPPVLMPRDEVAGGTWLGLNSHGLFVGITNRFGRPADRSRRSRGALVVEALRAPSAADLHHRLAGLDAASFNPFHLLYADAEQAFVTWSDGERARGYPVPPGVHVITERSLGADDQGRTERLERLFVERLDGNAPTIERLGELLVVHGPPGEPLAGSCVHADAFGYGTRSSFVYLGGSHPRAAWRDGHPCEGPLTDLAPLLRELSATAG